MNILKDDECAVNLILPISGEEITFHNFMQENSSMNFAWSQEDKYFLYPGHSP